MSSEVRTDTHVRVGSRKSQLALAQTNAVVDMLKENNLKTSYEIVSMSTIGDKILDKALSKIGEKSLFTKELELGLEAKEFDFIVHSLKDLPTTLPEGMVVCGIPKRLDPADAVIMHKDHNNLTLNQLPSGSVIGTSSLRRSAQIKRNFPHLSFKDVRGNLNTRLSKLDDQNVYQALILAAAGVIRMGWSNRISKVLTPEECLYAAGQGALAVECRASDTRTIQYLSEINDEDTLLCCIAERALLKTLEGGCSAPVGVNSCLHSDGWLQLTAAVFSLDGVDCVKNTKKVDLNGVTQITDSDTNGQKIFCGIVSSNISEAKMVACEKLGIELAKDMLKEGAGKILQQAKAESKNSINQAPTKNGSKNILHDQLSISS